MILESPRTSARQSANIEQRSIPRWKRLSDLCLAALLTPMLAPILLLVGLYIKLVSPGPVLFVQSRVGHGGKSFRILKFRTMHVPRESRDSVHREYVNAIARGGEALQKPDYFKNELILGGELIRKCAIDELPQIFNVWRGNMTLVGPRPDVLRLEDYEPWQLRRFEVLPGITGLWQVSGKNRLTHDEMVALDIQYVDTCSWHQDLRILIKTFFVVLLSSDD